MRILKAGEQLVLRVALGPRGGDKPPPSPWGQRHEVTTPVDRVAPPGEQAVGFERIEPGDHDARICLHRLTELLLAHRPVFVQKAKELELARRELVAGVRRPQPPHRVMPEQREQKPRAGAELLQQASRGFGGFPTGISYRHVQKYIRL